MNDAASTGTDAKEKMRERARRNFASVDPEARRAWCAKAGRISQSRPKAKTRAHCFSKETAERAREMGRKGGVACSADRESMASRGRKGGAAAAAAKGSGHMAAIGAAGSKKRWAAAKFDGFLLRAAEIGVANAVREAQAYGPLFLGIAKSQELLTSRGGLGERAIARLSRSPLLAAHVEKCLRTVFSRGRCAFKESPLTAAVLRNARERGLLDKDGELTRKGVAFVAAKRSA
jgi:general stress protein YciG